MKFLDFVFFFQYFDNFETALRNRITDINNRLIRSGFELVSSADLLELYTLYIKIDLLRKIEGDLKSFFRDF